MTLDEDLNAPPGSVLGPLLFLIYMMASLGFSYLLAPFFSLPMTSCFIDWSLALKTLVEFRVTLMSYVTGYLFIN